MRLQPLAFALLALAGCDMPAPGSGCGVLGCISSPYLRARGGPALVGQPAMVAVNTMGGAPTGQFQADAQTQVLTWERRQNDADFGALVCTESVMVRGGRVADYGRRGNCGG